jgi:hypothetical protein
MHPHLDERAPKGDGAPAIEVTQEMIEAALDVLWEHRSTVTIDPSLQESLVEELLARALVASPSTASAARR